MASADRFSRPPCAAEALRGSERPGGTRHIPIYSGSMPRRRIAPVAWALVALTAAALLAFAIVLLWQALELNGDQGLVAGERAAVLQALAAAGALAGTAALVGVTAHYAWVTARILESGGPIIHVELKQAWIHASGGGSIIMPLARGLLSKHPDPEYPRFMFAVEVRNSGGAGTTIAKAAIEMEGGAEYWQPAPTVGPGFPHRLEPHSSVTFFIEPHPVSTTIEFLKVKPVIVGLVALASGATERTKPADLRQSSG